MSGRTDSVTGRSGTPTGDVDTASSIDDSSTIQRSGASAAATTVGSRAVAPAAAWGAAAAAAVMSGGDSNTAPENFRNWENSVEEITNSTLTTTAAGVHKLTPPLQREALDYPKEEMVLLISALVAHQKFLTASKSHLAAHNCTRSNVFLRCPQKLLNIDEDLKICVHTLLAALKWLHFTIKQHPETTNNDNFLKALTILTTNSDELAKQVISVLQLASPPGIQVTEEKQAEIQAICKQALALQPDNSNNNPPDAKPLQLKSNI